MLSSSRQPAPLSPPLCPHSLCRFAHCGYTQGSQHRVVRRLRRRPVEVCRPLYDILTSNTIPKDEPTR